MDEATLARAIEPFFSTKGIGKGTGLGLSMVHGLAAQLGGAMTIRSRPSVGTSVELWLPVATATAEPLEAAGDAERLTAAGTVLLVDDEDIVRASTAEMLSDLGYAVVEASSAEEALTLLDGGLVPGVVITDHLMPGKTGIDLGRVLKTRRPGMPLLIISGYAEDERIAPGPAPAHEAVPSGGAGGQPVETDQEPCRLTVVGACLLAACGCLGFMPVSPGVGTQDPTMRLDRS
jgi:CheY-like chemotaxis protein